MASHTLIAWLLLAYLAALVAVGAGRRVLSLRWWPSILLACLAAAATVSCLLTYRSYGRQTPVMVSISPFDDGESLGRRVRIAGTVQPADARVVLYVRAEKDTRWWPQPLSPRVTTGPNRARWTSNAYLGDERSGAGQKFMVVAVASADSWLFDLLTDRWVDDSPRTTIPRWGRSELVVVQRGQ